MQIYLENIFVGSNSFKVLVYQLAMGRGFLDIWTINRKRIPELKVPKGSKSHPLLQRKNLRIKEAMSSTLNHTAGSTKGWARITTMTSPSWTKWNIQKKGKWPTSSFCIPHGLWNHKTGCCENAKLFNSDLKCLCCCPSGNLPGEKPFNLREAKQSGLWLVNTW